MDSGWVASDCLLLRVSDLFHGFDVPCRLRRYEGTKVQDLKVSSDNSIQRRDMASIDEDQARYSDKLVRTQLLRLVVFPSDLTKLFPSGGSCGQARHFWAVSKPCWPVKTRGELSLQQFKSFCLTLSFRRLRPCANTGASTSLERYTTAAQRKS